MESNASLYFEAVLYPLLFSVPLWIVILVGFGVSLFKYKQSPKAALGAIIALVIMLFLRFLFMFYPVLSLYLGQSGTDIDLIRIILGTVNAAGYILEAIALGILLWAIWTKRE